MRVAGPVRTGSDYLRRVENLLRVTLEQVETARKAGVELEDFGEVVDLARYRQRFAGNDPRRRFARNACFGSPGFGSVWTSLGYPVPAGDNGD